MEHLFSSQIEPLVRQTIHRKFRSATTSKNDQEDVFSETLLKLWKQIVKWIESPSPDEISNLAAYIAATTLNTCKEYFRSKCPRRWHLRNRLRYLMQHSPGMSIWQAQTGEWLTGYSQWKEKNPVRSEEISGVLHFRETRQPKLLDAVQMIFRQASGPMYLDDLLAIVIALPGFREQFQDVEMQGDPEMEALADPRADLGIAGEKDLYLRQLWSEICALPVNQRAALLLNLRDHDGGDAITALPATGIASIRQIAEALEMRAEELAELWNDLPLEDARIADRLHLTRQQVINLRKSARQRLAYRMKKVAM